MPALTQSLACLLLSGLLATSLPSPGSDASPPKPPDRAEVRQATRKIGEALDRLSEVVDEFGSIHVSPPLLSEPGEDFRFDLHLGATNYFEAAKKEIDSGTAYFEQAIQSFGAALAGQADPTMTAAGLDKLREFQSIQGRRGQKQLLLDHALEEQLRADLAAANTLTNETARLNAIAAAHLRQATNFAAAEQPPQYPTATNESLPATARGLASRPTDLLPLLAGDRFAGFQGLRGDKSPTPTLSHRAALGRAAGDVATEAIFRMLGHPEKAEQLTGRRVLFGVIEVTVNPGWRTTEGYAADVSLVPEYHYEPARPAVVLQFLRDPQVPLEIRRKIAVDAGEELPANITAILSLEAKSVEWTQAFRSQPLIPNRLRYPDDHLAEERPLIFAISPFSDMEIMDQGLSLRRQSELSLSLSFALRYFGAQAQADAFEKFVRSRQSDASSRAAVSPITTYSDGTMAGFQVGPRFQAIGDATQKKQRSALKLGRQAFPALLIFGLDPTAVYPKIEVQSSGQWRLVEPNVRLSVVPNWRPLAAGRSRLREDQKLLLSVGLREAKTDYANKIHPNLQSTLDIRERVLKTHAFGHFVILPFLSPEKSIPLKEPEPAIIPAFVQVVPSELPGATGKHTNQVVLLGDHLRAVDLSSITCADSPIAQVKQTQRIGDTLLVDVEVSGAGQFVIEAKAPRDQTRLPQEVILRSRPVVVRKIAAPPEEAKESPPRPVIRTSQKGPDEKSTVERVIEVSPAASKEQLEAAREVYRTQPAAKDAKAGKPGTKTPPSE